MSGFARNKVAIVGYAQSDIRRTAGRTLGALTVDVARAAVADAGLELAQIDGYVSSSLMPSASGRVAEDGVSTVSSAWLAGRLAAPHAMSRGSTGSAS